MLHAQQKEFYFVVSPDLSGKRLDLLVADLDSYAQLTRSRIQDLIRTGNILVNDEIKKTGYRVRTGESIRIILPPPQPSSLIPQELEFEVLYEDQDVIVLSKPPGVVVHPSHGHIEGTLVHGLLHHCRNLSGIGGELRPGIVHRLDKDTSGVMIVAKNDMAHQSLVKQFKGRTVEKFYLALLSGIPRTMTGRIAAAIGRHPVHRKKMAVLQQGGRESVTNWEILEYFSHFSFVKLRLETGRTHQIRVHMASIGCPIAGDPVYGKKSKTSDLLFVRQCLHSYSLAFDHPHSGERLSFTAPLWPDMKNVVHLLRDRDAVDSGR
ncbi:MAG: RluA family pseudouridine synthase [Proteobacteria bacterium]|nr:RluA family pseudouridine synthase [Pseudomonadota bacterium]MBU4297666.1 RluA family pseudouridine synthase [Pseudomonadota bacterium]MCG2748379.1 RluA family pseudouridine synthase [Desulfobulbaceae bacterium]